jgi:hypothetical protein
MACRARKATAHETKAYAHNDQSGLSGTAQEAAKNGPNIGTRGPLSCKIVNGAPGEIRTRTALVLSEMPPTNWATGAWTSLQALLLLPPPYQSGALPNEQEHDSEKACPWA